MTNLLELINSGVTDVTVNVKLADLVELIKQTIEAAKAELLPAMVSAAQEVLLTKKEVMEKFGVCHTTLWNLNKNKILIPVIPLKVGKKVCYRQSDVERLILERDRK